DDVGVVDDDEEDVDPAVLAVEETGLDVAELVGGDQGADVFLDLVGVVLDAGPRLEHGGDGLGLDAAVAGDLDVGDDDFPCGGGLLREAEPAAEEDAEKDGRQTGRSRGQAYQRAHGNSPVLKEP